MDSAPTGVGRSMTCGGGEEGTRVWVSLGAGLEQNGDCWAIRLPGDATPILDLGLTSVVEE